MIGKFFNSLLSHGNNHASAPVQAPGEYKRFNDAILVISQDNFNRNIPVKAANERAIKLIGYTESEILSLDLRELLPPEIKETVEDYIEFSVDGKPINEILQKVANFRLLGSRNRQIPVKLRVIRGVSDADSYSFRLVMNDISLLETLREARLQYSALAAKEFLMRDMQQVIRHGKEVGYESTYAVVSFTDGGTHIKRAEKMIESTKRDTDIIGPWNESTLVYIMPDTPTNNALTPLNRFKNSLPEDIKTKLVLRYAKVEEGLDPASQIKLCIDGKNGRVL